MTEAEGAAIESAQAAPVPSAVDMQPADTPSPEQVHEIVPDLSSAASAVQNDVQEDEQTATRDAEAAANDNMDVVMDSVPDVPMEHTSTETSQSSNEDIAPASTAESTSSSVEDVPVLAVVPTAEVKPELEQPASTKRKELSSPTSAPTEGSDEAVTVGATESPGSADTQETAPAVKKQKIDETPSASQDPAPVPSKSSAPVAVAAVAPAPAATPSSAPLGNISSAPLMISRDDMAKMEEDGGLVKFDVITNDGRGDHMMQLTTLKNIFARQLPKMPREYIVRLVLDRNHRSMIILKNGKTVIGGICYRPFEPNHFAEIAFCAINAADQVKGYGTRLMNHLKEYVKGSGITHFLTYADNYAIGYFKKQGFAKVVSMPRPNWFGYIKDYDGGTLMECTIHHQINYLRITSMVQQQRKKIQDKIKERSHTDIIYPGLSRFAEGRTMDLYMIPGVQEAGWSRAVIRNNRVGTRDPGSLKTQLQQLWKHISSHRSAWPFHEPVDTEIVVDYLDYIKEPVDLTLVQKRIESGHYLSKQAFKEDLEKMCNNCMLYNTPDTNYYKAAKDLQEFIEKRVQVAK